MRETTALGAAIAAGFAVGVWKEFDELKEINQKDRMVFKPNVGKEEGEKMFKKWGRVSGSQKPTTSQIHELTWMITGGGNVPRLVRCRGGQRRVFIICMCIWKSIYPQLASCVSSVPSYEANRLLFFFSTKKKPCTL